MRLLLDECVPRPLVGDLVAHDVHHVVDMGWSSKHNGELLKLMVAERFEALLAVDQNIEFQQNVRASGIGVVVVVVRRNRLKELRPLVPQILDRGTGQGHRGRPHHGWWPLASSEAAPSRWKNSAVLPAIILSRSSEC